MEAAIREDRDPSAADEQFHIAIARAADNALLADLMQQLAKPIARTRTTSLKRHGRAPRSLEGHRRILDAIDARDEQGAAAAMLDHLRLVADVAHDSELGYPPTGPGDVRASGLLRANLWMQPVVGTSPTGDRQVGGSGSCVPSLCPLCHS